MKRWMQEAQKPRYQIVDKGALHLYRNKICNYMHHLSIQFEVFVTY